MNRIITKQLLFLSEHIEKSISYNTEGTFHIYNEKTGEYTFDKKGADYARKCLVDIANALK